MSATRQSFFFFDARVGQPANKEVQLLPIYFSKFHLIGSHSRDPLFREVGMKF